MDIERTYETLQRYANSRGMELNKDRELVYSLIEGLLINQSRYGYRSCPCRLASGVLEKDRDIICPCIYSEEDIREYGRCYCGLYVSKDYNQGKIPDRYVPERRERRDSL